MTSAVAFSLLLLVMTVAYLELYHSLPIDSENEVDGDSEEFLIDFTELEPRLYGSPSPEAGELVSTANMNNTNPEELGPYLEGDILIPRPRPKSGLRSGARRWSQGTIPYEISPDFDAADVSRIYLAIEQYHKYTCIRLVPRTEHDIDYVVFTNDRSGCWASCGRIGGRQQVNVQSGACTYRLGTIIHEIMHAIGFMHEQNRPDRDNWVDVYYDNIRNGLEGNFLKLSPSYVKTFDVPYDYNSVMHYNAYSFSKNGQPTIVPLQESGDQIGQRKQLSQLDIKKVNKMYKCNGKQSGIP